MRLIVGDDEHTRVYKVRVTRKTVFTLRPGNTRTCCVVSLELLYSGCVFTGFFRGIRGGASQRECAFFDAARRPSRRPRAASSQQPAAASRLAPWTRWG